MTACKERWRQWSRLQRGLLLALAAMVVVFGVLTAVLNSQTGILFRGGFLRAREVEGRLVFSGKVDGQRVTVARTAAPDGAVTVELTIGDLLHDVGQVERTPSTVPANFPSLIGITVWKSGQRLFQGGYNPDGGFLMTSDGELEGSSFPIYFSSGSDPWQGYRLEAGPLVSLAFQEPLAHRSSWILYLTATFFAGMLALYIAFPEAIFQLNHRRWVKDPEPTEYWWDLTRVCWLVGSILLLIFYILALWTVF